MTRPEYDPLHAALYTAQFNASVRQIPMMYFILLTSTWALAVTYIGAAPDWLTIGVPVLLTFCCLLRMWSWLRRRTGLDLEQTVTALRRTRHVSGVIAAAFSGWALALVPYGDAYMQSHVAFYMATTVFACIISLMHLRRAAINVMIVVIGSFVLFFAATGRPSFVAITVNVLFVCFGLITLLQVNFRTFAQMVAGQQAAEALGAENARLANLDPLTGLPNRRAFFSRLQTEHDAARQVGSRLALGVIDLDGFKPVNDLYGHSIGDKLLTQVGERLDRVLAESGAFVARLGGDEFAFIVPGGVDEARLTAIGDQVSEALRRPFVLPEATVVISASVGCAIADTTMPPEHLFDRADYALYQGKQSNRRGSTLFGKEHDAKLHRDYRVEQALRAADLAAELFVAFQPILNISSGRLNGFEALARWNSPVLGEIPPGVFIPIAERSGLIADLTPPLLKSALAVAVQWPGELRLAFNLSPHDLNSEDGMMLLITTIEQSGIDPRRLDFEITESALGHDVEQVMRSIQSLRELGCGISLDDFGTGYSSLSRLHSLPLTQVKIDRSFITAIDPASPGSKIVRSVLALSRDMGLECVLEGIETEAELAVLRGMGATLIQGYLVSRPVFAPEVSGLISRYGVAQERVRA